MLQPVETDPYDNYYLKKLFSVARNVYYVIYIVLLYLIYIVFQRFNS